MNICKIENRVILEVSGKNNISFLQALLSNDVEALKEDRAIYACLLTPQGKFLYDFILSLQADSIFLECEKDRISELEKTLKLYALRADVVIKNLTAEYNIYAIWNTEEKIYDNSYLDPRNEKLGFRYIAKKTANIETNTSFKEYDKHRILLTIPDGSRDMEVKLSNLLEYNIDKLNGISWDKGCYVGQELTARIKYRGLLKKSLFTVKAENSLQSYTDIKDEKGGIVGKTRSGVDNIALAVLKLETIDKSKKLFVDGKEIEIIQN